jgi:F-type H+-transporting ATPase subunit delta
MALSTRIAKRYAKAVVGLAQDKNELDRVKSDMKAFISVSKSNRDFELMLISPIVPQDKKADILEAIFKGKVSEVSENLFKLLANKKREAYLTLIAQEFIAQYNLINKIQVATLYTAIEVSDSVKIAAKELIAKATGKTVILEEKIKEDLIGGYILRIEDVQLDASVKSQLNKLSIKFKNA